MNEAKINISISYLQPKKKINILLLTLFSFIAFPFTFFPPHERGDKPGLDLPLLILTLQRILSSACRKSGDKSHQCWNFTHVFQAPKLPWDALTPDPTNTSHKLSADSSTLHWLPLGFILSGTLWAKFFGFAGIGHPGIEESSTFPSLPQHATC